MKELQILILKIEISLEFSEYFAIINILENNFQKIKQKAYILYEASNKSEAHWNVRTRGPATHLKRCARVNSTTALPGSETSFCRNLAIPQMG